MLSKSTTAAMMVAEMCFMAGQGYGGTRSDTGGNITVQNEGPLAPRVVFATEGTTEGLNAILAKPEVIAELQKMHAGMALATEEMSPERARIVEKLNEAGIPATAWLTLPKQQGYYVNASNAEQTALRFEAFEEWSAKYRLRWAGVGLDIEPNIREFMSFLKGDKLGLAWTLFKRYFELGQVNRARAEYAALIRKMQADGYSVETYQFPFLADERKEHTTVLERLLGIVDVRGNVEVLMVYTSFHPSLDSAMIWAYGPDAQALAVGVTSGTPMGPSFSPLEWPELSRDMIVASHYTRTIGVYNLEGCVAKGFLPKIQNLNWDQAVTIPAADAQRAVLIRSRVQSVLWIVAHLLYFAAAIMMAVICAIWWCRGRYRIRDGLERSRRVGSPT